MDITTLSAIDAIHVIDDPELTPRHEIIRIVYKYGLSGPHTGLEYEKLCADLLVCAEFKYWDDLGIDVHIYKPVHHSFADDKQHDYPDDLFDPKDENDLELMRKVPAAVFNEWQENLKWLIDHDMEWPLTLEDGTKVTRKAMLEGLIELWTNTH